MEWNPAMGTDVLELSRPGLQFFPVSGDDGGGGGDPLPPETGLVFRLVAEGQSFAADDPVDTAVATVGPNMTEAVESQRPIFKTNVLDGRSAFRFGVTGTNKRLTSVSNINLSGTNKATFAIIGGPTTGQGEVSMLHFGSGGVASDGGFAFWPNIGSGVIEVLNTSVNWKNITGAGVGNKAYLISIDRSLPGANEMTLRLNGAAASTAAISSNDVTVNFVNGALTLGARPSNDLFCLCDVLEVAIWDHAFDGAEIAAFDDYVAAVYPSLAP